MRPVRTRPGPTSMNVVTPVGAHPLDGRHPVDAGREVVDELGPAPLGGRDRRGIGVGEERRGRVAEGDRRERLPHPVGGLGHQRRVGGDRDGQLDRPLRAQLLRDAERGLDGGPLARDDDLARRVAVRDAEDAVCPGALDELRQAGVVEADDRRHPALVARARRLHEAAPGPDEADGVGEVEGAGGDEGGVLAHRVAGGEGRCGRVDRELGPARADGLEVGDRGGEQRGLGVLRPVQLVLGSVPGEPADRLRRGRAIGGLEHGGGGRGGLGEGASHPHELAALAGKHEGDLGHRGPAYGESRPVGRAGSVHGCRNRGASVRSTG